MTPLPTHEVYRDSPLESSQYVPGQEREDWPGALGPSASCVRRRGTHSDVSYIVLQCVAVCCSVLQCVAVWCSVVQCVAVCCSGTVCCSALQCDAVCCSALQCDAVCCSALQCDVVCCSVSLCGKPIEPYTRLKRALGMWICTHMIPH